MNNEIIYSSLLIIFGFLVLLFLGNNYFSKNIEGYANDIYTNDHSMNNSKSCSTSNSYNPHHQIQNPNHKKHFDNYNHFAKTVSPLKTGQVFHSPSGGTITVSTNGDGSQSLLISKMKEEIPVLYTNQKPSSTNTENYSNYNTNNSNQSTIFYGPSGSTATVVMGNNGQEAIAVNTSSGLTTYILDSNSSIINTPTANYTTTSNDSTTPVNYSLPNYNPSQQNPWMSSLPPGIPFKQIAPGEEDLYILKSEIVPPVCPVCNISQAQNLQTCPPCKPCGRCELPPFECKKVPNYSALSNEFQPVPVLNDFSGFGM